MNQYRGRAGSGPDQFYLSTAQIERMCIEELRRANLLPSAPEPIRIERFIEKRFALSPTYEELPPGVLGFTEFGRDGVTAIVVSREFQMTDQSQVQERRLRSTLAHEAGHGLMHAHLFATGDKPASLFDDASTDPTILCRDVTGNSARQTAYSGRWWEYQANRAIGGLLTPRKLVHAVVAEFTEPGGLLGHPVLPPHRRDAAIRAIASVFEVNPVVARYRLDELFPPG